MSAMDCPDTSAEQTTCHSVDCRLENELNTESNEIRVDAIEVRRGKKATVLIATTSTTCGLEKTIRAENAELLGQ